MKYSIFIFFVVFHARILALYKDCIGEARHSCSRFAHPEQTALFCMRYQMLWKCFHKIDPYCMEQFKFMYIHKCMIPKAAEKLKKSSGNTVGISTAFLLPLCLQYITTAATNEGYAVETFL
ncbi:uncharacterized protein LOC128249826 isoform X3 [Octopus bimaculoides]|uniref:uncharacterized protein LOC128249826 isoform X3 n=1 Tax=Octopus bimaculoides TaxID=37653 RepID=UPI0022E55B92|nr:uncharacterized protein LOC128249826 isoform X3 [Octopus bimaculoides]